jgi:hypothetical protein
MEIQRRPGVRSARSESTIPDRDRRFRSEAEIGHDRPESPVTLLRNDRSRSPGIRGHDPPESPVTIDRNPRSRWSGIRTSRHAGRKRPSREQGWTLCKPWEIYDETPCLFSPCRVIRCSPEEASLVGHCIESIEHRRCWRGERPFDPQASGWSWWRPGLDRACVLLLPQAARSSAPAHPGFRGSAESGESSFPARLSNDLTRRASHRA